jgi:acyl carrier protein
MVPAQVVVMASFPQTPNGKTDRNALSALVEDVAAPEAEVEEPATVIEEALTSLWSELLGVKHLGRKDNFFELGGHSLLAMQLVSRIRSSFGVDLPLKSLFERPTIAGLAEAIDALSWANKGEAQPQAVGEREEVEV